MSKKDEKKDESMKERVYFTHKGGPKNSSAADFFIKGISPINSEKEAERIAHTDYYIPDCTHVREFLRNNPEYVYVGSTDNVHDFGWGMNFDGYKKVATPMSHKNISSSLMEKQTSGNCPSGYEWVPSYYKSNGTYVKGFCRSRRKPY